ncbi:hypothetical protein VNO77_04318 [Canavalia gladiata]|uniref:Uncharacterized protein n=1 Tax=Canavalia gladiata TaxID=3824 RepID=A0AAN9N1F7_CANGL
MKSSLPGFRIKHLLCREEFRLSSARVTSYTASTIFPPGLPVPTSSTKADGFTTLHGRPNLPLVIVMFRLYSPKPREWGWYSFVRMETPRDHNIAFGAGFAEEVVLAGQPLQLDDPFAMGTLYPLFLAGACKLFGIVDLLIIIIMRPHDRMVEWLPHPARGK